MKNFLWALVFLLSGWAQAGQPTKSSVCALTLNAITRISPVEQSPVYTLNALRAFRENVLNIQKVGGGNGEGYASKFTHTSGFDKIEVAQRLKGIELFARRDNADLAKQNFTRVIVLSGRDDIQNFIDTLIESFNTSDRQMRRMLLSDYKTLLISSAVLLPVLFRDPLNTVHGAGVFAILMALSVSSKADHFMLRPFYKDRRVIAALNSFKTLLALKRQNTWALYSRNAYLTGGSVLLARQTTENSDDLLNALAKQSVSEPPSILGSIAERAARPAYWAGIDFYLETSTTVDPELHVIFRGSDRRPLFPKMSNSPAAHDVKETTPAVLEPAFEPSH